MNNSQNQSTNQHSNFKVNQGMANQTLAQPQEWKPGEILDTPVGIFTIDEKLGPGGFGITYKVTNKKGEFVVLKTLNSKAQNHKDVEKFKQDLRDEAVTLQRLNHINSPCIVKGYRLSEFKGLPFVIMEYVEGENLAGEHYPPRKALDVIRSICGSLIPVHDLKIIHRDIKPSNIIFSTKYKRPILIDFGIARNFADDTTLTGYHSGVFSAPEQKIEQKQGAYTDIYSLGVTLYSLITGYSSPDINSLNFPDNVSEELKKAIIHAIEIDYTKRPQTLEEWLKELPLPEKEDNQISGKNNSVSQETQTIITPTWLIPKILIITGLGMSVLASPLFFLLNKAPETRVNDELQAETTKTEETRLDENTNIKPITTKAPETTKNTEIQSPPTKLEESRLEENTQVKTLVHKDVKNGFSIKYPKNWGLKNAQELEFDGTFHQEALELLPPFQEITSDTSKVYSRVVVDIINNDQPLQEYYQSQIDNVSQNMPQGKVLKQEPVKVKRNPAYKIVFTGKDGNDDIKRMQFLMTRGDKKYVVTYESLASQFDQFEAEAQIIMESFALLN